MLYPELEVHRANFDGRLIILPCKIGDTVYFIGDRCTFCDDSHDHCKAYCKEDKAPRICSTKIVQFRITGDQFDSMTDTNCLFSSMEHDFYLRDIGETVFLTEMEAETALKRSA